MADDFQRIQSNVQKMVDQGAPEVDIDGYLAEEGLDAGKFKSMAEASQRPENQGAGGFMQNVRAFGNKATDWMMLGKKDEILAGMLTPFVAQNRDLSLGDAYKAKLGELEGDAALYEQQAPIADNVGAVVGAVTGAPGQAGAKFVQKGATMAGRTLRSVLPGTLAGTVSGAEGDTIEDRAEGAVWSGVGGGMLAPLGQIGGELLGKFISALTRGKQTLPAVAQGSVEDPLKAAVQQQRGPLQVSAENMQAGVQRLMKALADDGVDVPKLIQMAQAGQLDDRTLAGLAGPNTRQLIDTFASMNGPAKTIVAGSQRAAEQGQGAALTNAANSKLGAGGDFVAAGDVLENQMKAAGPLYDAAFQNARPVNVAPVIAKLDAEIAQAKGGVKAALEKARALLMDANGAPDASLHGLHNSKIALDDLYQSMGKDSSMGNIARSKVLGVIKDLLGEMDSSNPGYATARDAFAGPAAVEDAMQLGRSILKDDWIGNVKEIGKMTASEKQGLIEGAAQAWRDMVEGISSKADKAARMLNYDKFLNRIRGAFPSQSAFDQFKQALQSQSSEFSAVQMAGKGSQTVPRLADALDQGIETAANAGRAATGDKGGLLQLGKDAVRWLTAPNAQARAAAVSAGLGKIKDTLPYLTPAASLAPPVLGTALSAASAIPASRTKAMADLLMGPR